MSRRSPMPSGRATGRPDPWGRAPPCASSARRPLPTCSRGSTRTSREAGRNYFLRMPTGQGRWRCWAASTRRERSSPSDRAALEERGGGHLLANITAFECIWVELWAGDPAAAAKFGAEGWRLHEGLGESFALAIRGRDLLACALRARPARRGGGLGRPRSGVRPSGEPWADVQRQVKAKVLARRGEHAEAERLAREAVSNLRGDRAARPTGRRVRGPRRGAPARRESRRGGRRARAGARALRAEGKPRHGRADARSA